MPQKILITGGTGLIGTRLTELLIQKGHEVRHLSRNPGKNDIVPTFKWDVVNQTIDADALKDVDTIIHLAGAGIADERWSKERKKVILESRTQSTQLLNTALKDHDHTVKSFISASAIGYYGYDSGGVVKKEDSRFGDDFLATVTKAWEAKADELSEAHAAIRAVKIRIGIVLTEKGGALAEMAKPVKLWAGAPLGSGDQYMSWIHIDDLCNIFIHAVENQNMTGTYNAVAPNPVTNKDLTKQIAKALSKPLLLPNVPSFVMKIMLGEMASMVLGGSVVSSEKIEGTGFKFNFPNAEDAVNDLIKTP